MDVFWEELTFGLPDLRQLARVIIRLAAAAVLGALIGIQRERIGKPAGLRTHILVTLGSCAFVLAYSGFSVSPDGLSRVIQGIVTGIGFIGAGSILKLDEQRDIKGLTTAAGIWMASAIGVAVGLGVLGMAIIGTILTLIVLTIVGKIEFAAEEKRKTKSKNAD